MKVQVLTSEGCTGCEKLENMLKDFGIKFELIDVSVNPEILEKFPVFMAPALVIDEKLVLTGVPKKEELRKIVSN